MEPEVVGHTTFMGCVSATGMPSGSLRIFLGVRPLSKLTRQWSDCPFAMDLKGYMTQETFFSWAVRWEEKTRPADPDEPRCLFLDNHYSQKPHRPSPRLQQRCRFPSPCHRPCQRLQRSPIPGSNGSLVRAESSAPGRTMRCRRRTEK